MPTYDYRCNKCHHTFEAVQSMKDPHFKTCPEALCRNEDGWAQGEVVRQMGTGAGLIFKGSGFYITDYRSENYKEGAKKDAPATASPAAGDKGGGAGGATENSPAAPAPAKAKGEGNSSSGGSSSTSSPAAGSSPAPVSAPKT